MEPGCVSVERSADNLIERYRVRSNVYKHRERRVFPPIGSLSRRSPERSMLWKSCHGAHAASAT
ncbi:hypothetical protein IMCC21224_151 [Puniceibacterium sp. IMCC21224]|nr:hypothetical protein IMCC21224_151 [Puniceibacterium sp. IMCC21224]